MHTGLGQLKTEDAPNKNIPLDSSVGMQINRALSSEAKAYIRAGLPPVRRRTASKQREATR